MAKFRSQKNSLIAGEISPTAFGRSDLPQYLHACKTLRNMLPILSGGAYRRPGSLYETQIAGATDFAPRLLPFVVSKTEAYCLVMGKVSGGSGYVNALRPTSNLAVSTAGTVTGAHSYSQATAAAVSTVGYYDQWHDVQYIQSGDILYLVHPKYKPRRISRTAVDTFTDTVFDNGLTGATFREAWPYRAQNTTAITLQIDVATVGTGRILTASASFFQSTHVGAVFKVDNGGTIGCCKVTGYTSATQVTVEVMVAFGAAATPVATWWESAWSDYRGWPRAIGFFHGRLAYAGNATDRDSIWFSETDDYNQLSVSTIADPYTAPTGTQPFTLGMQTQELNLIQWVAAKDTFVVGTSGQEAIIDREIATEGFGCDNARCDVKTSYGSSYHMAVRAGNELIVANESDDELNALVFSENESSYISEPIQTFFDEYPKIEASAYTGNRKFRVFAWDRSRRTLWCVDTAGNLFAMTRDRRLGITAWTSHQMGGYDSSITGGTLGAGGTLTVDPAYAACKGSVISLAVVPNPLIGTNDIWLVVKRKINNAWQYQIERLIGKHVASETAYRLMNFGNGHYFVDAATFGTNDYPLAEDYIFGSMSYLNGETPVGTVSNTKGLFKVDGSVVSGGNTTMQETYPPAFTTESAAVIFGLGFNSIVEPVRIEAGSVIGSAQGAIKRIHRAFIRFYRTLSAKVGRDSSNLEQLQFREASTPLNKSAELFTGDKEVTLDSEYDRDGYIYVLQDQPLPFSVVSIISEGVTYD